jgi:nicotinate phosphoribosyltransferase
VCFPVVPLLRVEGPLALAQIIETPLLNIVGFPTLVCTNAVRMKQVRKIKITLIFFLLLLTL